MTSSNVSEVALQLCHVLAASFSAASYAGQVIRDVVHQGIELEVVNKADEKYDPQTIADRRAQQRIVYTLRHVWPKVQIVGEEGELEAPDVHDKVVADLQVLTDVAFQIPTELEGDLSYEDLVLWVDPLDGTKKFAEKKYDEVSVLIGIAYKHRPIAGVMHLPFVGEFGTTYWGGPGIGLFASSHSANASEFVHKKLEKPAVRYPSSRPLTVTVSGTNCDLVNQALQDLAPSKILMGGATGTMVLQVITGVTDAFFRFKNATKRWDICAVEPLIEAIGGSLVDKHGRVYKYDPFGDQAFDNAFGLIATLDPATTQLVQDVVSKIEALRTLDGQVMTAQWLNDHVFNNESTVNVHSVSVVPGSLHRGKHSIVAKLLMEIVSEEGNDQTTVMRQMFMKKAVKNELPARSDVHWARDLYSYRTETRVYSHYYAKLSPFVKLIRPLAVFYGIDGHGNESREAFMVLMENLDHPDSNYIQKDCLNMVDTKRALEYLASLHAAAWNSPTLLDHVTEDLWPTGSWWTFKKRGQAEVVNAPTIWSAVLASFASEMTEQGIDVTDERIISLGDRMVKNAEFITTQLFDVDDVKPLQTIVHGDCKSANLFFKETKGGDDDQEVVAFDWQWCGVGLGAMDVANLLSTSVAIEALSPDHEAQLLEFYYQQLMTKVNKEPQKILPRYTYKDFERHYILATLEYGRVLISNFWKGMTPATCVAKANKTNWGLGYRSIPHVLRMIQKLDKGLGVVEQEQLTNQ